ncbi:hypothetical protein KI387_038941, partial [Taxus chinensis]
VMGLLKAAMVSNTALNDVFKADTKSKYAASPMDSMDAMDAESARAAFQDLLLKLLKEDYKLSRN